MGATNNSISAVGKLILKYPHIAPPEQFWPLMLSWMPLNNGDGDTLEAQVVHALIVNEIQKNNVHILGNNLANLPQLLNILSGMLLPPVYVGEEEDEDEDANELVTDKTMEKIKQILASFQQSYPNETSQAFSALPEKNQRALQSLK